MRYTHAVLTACLVAGLLPVPAARAQDSGIQPYYWPSRTIGIPVRDVESLLKKANRPSDVQLYYWVNRGPIQKGPKLPLTGLQTVNEGKSGFIYTSDRDGDYEFAIQYIYPDGSTNPATASLTPLVRIVIDSTPPLIRLSPTNNGVDWVVTDDNLDPRKISLKCRWPGTRDWMPIKDREFQPIDHFAWALQPGKVLEARLEAEDRAGHKTVSPTVRIPPDGATATSFPRPAGNGPGWVSSTSPGLPAPRIEYVNTLKFDVDYTIQRMGRSGIQAAHLFVLRNQGDWQLVKRFPVKLTPQDKDTTLQLPYEAKEEGTYGFYVIPESGAGKRAEDPRKDDQPLVWVVVDTTEPYVKITGVQVKPGTRGPQVEITWEAVDPNLMQQGISLEWSQDKSAKRWNEIKYRLDNLPGGSSGRFVWDIPDENPWKFWIRARAVDKASNTGESIWPQEVIVDLEQPSAAIVKVRGGNTPPPANPPASKPPGGSDAPPPPVAEQKIPIIPQTPQNLPPQP